MRDLKEARFWLAVFIAGLVVSGVTAFPLVSEVHLLADWFPRSEWIMRVRLGLDDTYSKYPFLAYGTDWLAFAHLVIAIAFVGPWRDPVRNEWVITFGLIACLCVVPLALIAGPIRGIPLFWRLIDCTFGVVGLVPLIMARRCVIKMREGGLEGRLTSR